MNNTKATEIRKTAGSRSSERLRILRLKGATPSSAFIFVRPSCWARSVVSAVATDLMRVMGCEKEQQLELSRWGRHQCIMTALGPTCRARKDDRALRVPGSGNLSPEGATSGFSA